ncbi:hypothetical protein J3E68DRAFT_415085 [Trichoderma sp. SZMC 28012]
MLCYAAMVLLLLNANATTPSPLLLHQRPHLSSSHVPIPGSPISLTRETRPVSGNSRRGRLRNGI